MIEVARGCSGLLGHIRPAAASDLQSLEALYRRCRLLAEWLPPSERPKGDFASDTRGEMTFVALGEDGALEGFVSARQRESFVHHLYIRPESRGRGAGSRLLGYLSGQLDLPWRLKCVRANSAALAFYSRRGWKEIGSGTGIQGPHVVLECASYLQNPPLAKNRVRYEFSRS